jgi:hypothetical protein
MSAGYRPSIKIVRFQRRKIVAPRVQGRLASLRPFFGPSDVEHCSGGWCGVRQVKIRGAAAAPANRAAESWRA